MPNSVETVFVFIFLAALGIYLFLDFQRTETVLDNQQVEMEQVTAELKNKLNQINQDLEVGKITYEEASQLRRKAAVEANRKNTEILQQTMDELTPDS